MPAARQPLNDQPQGGRALPVVERRRNSHHRHQHRPRFGGEDSQPLRQGDQSRHRRMPPITEVLDVHQGDELDDHRCGDLDQVAGGVGIEPHQPQQHDQQCQCAQMRPEPALGEQADLVDADETAQDEHRQQREQEPDRDIAQDEDPQRRGQSPEEQSDHRRHPEQSPEEHPLQFPQCGFGAEADEVEIEDAGTLVTAPEQRQYQVEELERVDVLPTRHRRCQIESPGIGPVEADQREDEQRVQP